MEHKLSQRQFFVLLFVALLSPLVRSVPRLTAQQAGNVAWAAPLLALPVLLGLAALMNRCFRRLQEGEGLAELFCISFGQRIGRVLCLLYGVWFIVLLWGSVRFYSERFVSTIYPNVGMELFAGTLCAYLLWQRHKKLEAMGRTGQIFFFIIVLTVGLVVILSVGNLRMDNLLPLYPASWTGLAQSGMTVLLMMSHGVGACFLYHKVERRSGLGAAVGWITALCVIVLVMSLVVIGVFGDTVTTQLQVPFFSLAKEVQIEGALERVESAVGAMWVFTDILLAGLLLRACCTVLTTACQLRENNRLEGPLIVLTYAGCWVVASSAFRLELFYETIMAVGDGVFFLALPAAACAVGIWRKEW